MEVIVLNDYWPEYRMEAPLIPDLMHIVISYLIEHVKTNTEEYTSINGLKHGLCREWYSDGKLKQESHYKYGIKDGLVQYCGVDHVCIVNNYKDGLKHGLQTWDFYGMKGEENYKDDQKDGVQLTWYDDGIKRSEENYKNGKLDGAQREWHPDGKPISVQNYKDGELDGVQYKWNGRMQLVTEIVYKQGILIADHSPGRKPKGKACKAALLLMKSLKDE